MTWELTHQGAVNSASRKRPLVRRMPRNMSLISYPFASPPLRRIGQEIGVSRIQPIARPGYDPVPKMEKP